MGKTGKVIQQISPHTVKKIHMIQTYVQGWAQKLINYSDCKELVFIDCMCNSGEYYLSNRNKIKGTPVMVANILSKVAEAHKDKNIKLILNDFNNEKIEHLKTLLPKNTENFKIETYCTDANILLKEMGRGLRKNRNRHILLVYDPYDASIDWEAIEPFLNCWGEVIINHMVSDSIRAVKAVKSDEAKRKYERTYLESIDKLLENGNDKEVYEQRIKEIIQQLNHNPNRKYFIASFPFFNRRNAIVYNLIYITRSIDGLILFKECAWKTFDGKSSNKNLHGSDIQYVLDLDSGQPTINEDEYCYTLLNVCDYIKKEFEGRKNVQITDIWELINFHPVFPTDGFKTKIKSELRKDSSITIHRQTIDF